MAVNDFPPGFQEMLSFGFIEARSAASEVLRLYPNFSVEDFEKTLPYKNQADREFFINGLHKAGLK